MFQIQFQQKNFYCNQLGFVKSFAYRPFGGTEPCYLGLVRDDIKIHLSFFPEDGKSRNAIVLIVDDEDALLNEFVSKEVKIDLVPIKDVDLYFGNSKLRTHSIHIPKGKSYRSGDQIINGNQFYVKTCQ